MSQAPPDQTPSDGENPSESVEQRLARQRREAALRLSTGDAPATPAEPASDKPGEAPYFEAKVSPIGGDIDSAGGRIMVWPDRLEVIDATGRLDGRMPIDTIAKVKVTKRLTSVTVKITGSTHRRLTIKGVKPADATGLRHALADLRTPNPDGSRGVPTADAIRHLKELVDIGILTDEDFNDRRSRLRGS